MVRRRDNCSSCNSDVGLPSVLGFVGGVLFAGITYLPYTYSGEVVLALFMFTVFHPNRRRRQFVGLLQHGRATALHVGDQAYFYLVGVFSRSVRCRHSLPERVVGEHLTEVLEGDDFDAILRS